MNKLPELQNRDLKKLEQQFDIERADILSARIANLSHLKVLRKTDFYADWMAGFVRWEDGFYYGTAPDDTLLARDQDPLAFLKLYKEACNEWERQEKQHQKDCGLS